jgi:hypothetical protein
MAEENQTAGAGEEQLTQEQLDAQAAEKYRAQFNKGDASAQVVDEGAGNKPERPAHIPEKFWDAEKGEVRVEDLAKSYAELEKKGAKPAPAAEAGDENLTEEQKAEKAEAEKVARETLGLPSPEQLVEVRTKMTEKLLAGEAFDDSDYAPFEKLGFDRNTIDTIGAGLVALGEVHKAAVHKEAGGEEQYTAMLAWAKDEFTPEEIVAYNRDVHSNDKAVSLNAVRGLSARYKLSIGRPGRDATSKGAGKATDGYKSKAEMVTDMRDPKYAKDPAFRDQVAQKIRVARAAGIDLTV